MFNLLSFISISALQYKFNLNLLNTIFTEGNFKLYIFYLDFIKNVKINELSNVFRILYFIEENKNVL